MHNDYWQYLVEIMVSFCTTTVMGSDLYTLLKRNVFELEMEQVL